MLFICLLCDDIMSVLCISGHVSCTSQGVVCHPQSILLFSVHFLFKIRHIPILNLGSLTDGWKKNIAGSSIFLMNFTNDFDFIMIFHQFYVIHQFYVGGKPKWVLEQKRRPLEDYDEMIADITYAGGKFDIQNALQLVRSNKELKKIGTAQIILLILTNQNLKFDKVSDHLFQFRN